MKIEKYRFNFLVALEAVDAHLGRSVLTALGIIFGVGAVIAMLAVGTGAKQDILDQIKLVGVNNIVIQPVKIRENSGNNGEENTRQNKQEKKYSGGLTLEDGKGLIEVIPQVERISPEIIIETFAIRSGKQTDARLVGVTPAFFNVFNLELSRGKMFNKYHMKHGKAVCIIGSKIAARFFSREDPVGKKIKLGKVWLTITGVMKSRNITQNTKENLGIRNYNLDVYVPVNTALLRFKDRSRITKESFAKRSRDEDDDGKETKKVNYNQLDKLVVQVRKSEYLKPVSEVIGRYLKRHHSGITDFRVTVPVLLLRQQQRTKNIFNVVLGSIAGISLLVGGIGIMNIMLASVWERVREIGVRRAVGAQKPDIVFQFLSESVIISVSGGLAGIIFGVAVAKGITAITGISTIVTFPAVLLSFMVAAIIGLVFGIMPARRAARQNPIESLRHE